MKPGILLVHGVNSRGEWFSSARKALSPHFECVDFTYDGYRGLASVRAVFGNRKLVTRLADSWSEADRELEPTVHILAHSFGAVLTQEMLSKYSRIAAGTVFLVGSAGKNGPRWGELAERDTFQRLFNIVNGRDGIVRWVAWLPRQVRSAFGHLGIEGLTSDDGTVHDLHETWDCVGATPLCRARLHNVFFPEFTHSDFLTEHEIRYSVLPVLWDVPPPMYRRFLTLCRLIAAGIEEKNEQTAYAVELGQLKFSWLGGHSLRQHFSTALGSKRNIRRAVDFALAYLAVTVNAAHEHREQAGAPYDARFLEPRLAIVRAVKFTLEKEIPR